MPQKSTSDTLPRPYLVALTGGIASGKTAVSDQLAGTGILVIDTDVVAREVVKPGTVGLSEIIRVFGEDILQSNGALDRRALGLRVFNSPAARNQLEAITHPLIRDQVRADIDAARGRDVIVLVVPLLIESGLFEDADEVLVIDVPESTQRERLILRDDINVDQADKIMAAQTSRNARLGHADFVIENSGTRDQLEDQVTAYLGGLKARLNAHSESSTKPQA